MPKKLEKIEKRLKELDRLIWQKNRELSGACFPYDMSKERAALVSEEKTLEKEKEKLLTNKKG